VRGSDDEKYNRNIAEPLARLMAASPELFNLLDDLSIATEDLADACSGGEDDSDWIVTSQADSKRLLTKVRGSEDKGNEADA
jgi:hypothetical protein